MEYLGFKLIFKEGKVEGYGGRGYWWIKVIYNNLLLEGKKVYSEYDLGRLNLKLELKWKKIIKSGTFYNVIKNKPQASELCYHCKQDTIDGASRIGTDKTARVYCYKKECEEALKQYQKELIAEEEAYQRQQQEDLIKQRNRLEEQEERMVYNALS